MKKNGAKVLTFTNCTVKGWGRKVYLADYPCIQVWCEVGTAKSPERWVRVTKKYGTFQEVFFWVVSVSTIFLHVHPLLFGEDEPILTN